MYLHKTKNGHYTPPCCYFSGELEVVECLGLILRKNGMFYRFGLIEVPVKQDEPRSDPTS